MARTARFLTLVVALIFNALFLATPISAQTTSARATVSGTVSDTSHGALPGVSVTLSSGAGVEVARTVTGLDGRFTVSTAVPGPYRLEATLSGFRLHTADVVADPATPLDLEITLELAPVVESVTVTRTIASQADVPQAVTVIEGDRAQSFQRRASPAEAFMGTPGLFVDNRRNYSLSGGVRFAIRAPLPRFGMRGVQILQDGVPMTMADGTTEPTNLDLASLGKAEVLRGPSAVLYGNAAGGVISIESEAPSSTLLVEPTVQWGSFGYNQQGVKASGTSGRTSYLVSANRLHTDGFRQHSVSDVRRANVLVRTALTPRTELRVVYNLYDLPFGQSASTVTLADARNNPTVARPQAFTQGWGEQTWQQQGGVTLSHRFVSRGTLRTTFWTVRRSVWNPVPSSVVDVQRRAGGVRSEYSVTAPVGGHPVTATTGFDLSLQHDDRTEMENLGVLSGATMTRAGAARLQQQERVRSASPFVLLSTRLGARWQVSAGVRSDRFFFRARDQFLSNGDQSGTRRMHAASPMAGVTFVPTSWLNLYGNVATSFQTPTAVELSNRADGLGGFNPDLGPERLRSAEVGARGAIPALRARFELASYLSRVDDGLVRFTRADEQAYFRNAGRTSRRGVEALIEWMPASRLHVRTAYTWQRFVLDQFVAPEGNFSGKREPGAPPHQLMLASTYTTRSGLFSALQYRFVAAYPANSLNTLDNWSYHVVDARVGVDRRWGVTRWRPFVTIDNLFNQRYNSSVIVNSLADRHFEPAPGREFAVGITLGVGSR